METKAAICDSQTELKSAMKKQTAVLKSATERVKIELKSATKRVKMELESRTIWLSAATLALGFLLGAIFAAGFSPSTVPNDSTVRHVSTVNHVPCGVKHGVLNAKSMVLERVAKTRIEMVDISFAKTLAGGIFNFDILLIRDESVSKENDWSSRVKYILVLIIPISLLSCTKID